ncbi:MAG: dehydrogenase E1 component subunit alpha/beta [Acidobacteriia bacterium]|nr:dehydrogenase E1 component subunit alpha/beta [Terriglobia bacterium]
MAVHTSPTDLNLHPKTGGIQPEDLIRAYRAMYTARRLDDREILLKRQNKIFFQISGAGHEAVQAAAGLSLRAGHDWVFPYYRDRALCLLLGVTPEQMLLQAFGAASDPASGGRQMPSHWSSPALHIVSASSPTGTQFVQAVGCAHACRHLDPEARQVTLVCSGEGATSEGEFWEALNTCCLDKLPVVFLVEDNGYAISVPVEHQTAGGNIARLVSGFPGLLRLEVNGTSLLDSCLVMRDAVEYARSGRGPALVRALVTRPYSHSLSDDETLYKTSQEREQEAALDCVLRCPEWLVREGVLDRHSLQLLTHEVECEIQEATDRALRQLPPAPETALRFLYSEQADPTSAVFQTPAVPQGEPRTMVDTINRTLAEEMERNGNVVVFGEDVADCSLEENLPHVKGKGGVFKATQGLQRRFGSTRCFNTPLAEAAIAGRALGMAVRGLKPVAEIQFFDYIWPAMMQIRNEIATLRWRSHNGFSCPLVLRVPIGGYLTGGAIYHSQCGEVIFTHIPGLRVVMPSNAQDACGLLRTAIRCQDPVLFLEHKKLYREAYNRSPHPGAGYLIPFGKARLVKAGSQLTIITYGATVQKSLQAALQMEQKLAGASIEVLDLRSLAPYDWSAIAESVKKTNRVMIVHEDCLSWGYGAELAARIAGELFEFLDAPIGRVGAKDTWVGYSPAIEDTVLPQTAGIAQEIERLLSY